MLQAADAGEIIANIQDDDDKLEEVAKASIIKLTPDKVSDALIEAWNADQLTALANRLTTYLRSLNKNDLSIPSQFRRTAPPVPPS